MLEVGVSERHTGRAKRVSVRRAAVVVAFFFVALITLASVLGSLPSGRVIAAAPAAPHLTDNVLALNATADTYISQSAPGTNYGAAPNIWIRRDAGGNEDHALLAFDTSALPDDIVVVSATLRLYSEINIWQPAAPAAALSVQPEAALTGWTEMGVTWNNRPLGSNRGDPAAAYEIGWQYLDVTNIVQDWVDGAVANHGILLTPQSGGEGAGFYLDRSHTTTGPRLTIEYEAAPCTPISAVTISGPTAGQTDANYNFHVSVQPTNATEPLSYTWQTLGKPTTHASNATYNWDTAGEKLIRVTVENCGGSVIDTHTITLEEPAPTCDTPLEDLTLTGPTSGAIGRTYTFSAVASPSDANTPISFAWEATGQTPVEESGNQTASEIAWAWNTTGDKQIIVTAENCGATFVRQHTIEVVASSTLPDLVPGEPWYDAYQGAVGYIVRNDGQNDAPPGHNVALSWDSVQQTSTTITETIPGGGIRAGMFDDATDGCTGNASAMTIQVDDDALIEEGQENNNDYSANWPCDLRVPQIIAGPTATNIRETAVDIAWTTDEPAAGRVEYGMNGYAASSVEAGDLANGYVHELNDLQPGTTYRARVFATDETGNETNSEWIYFETSAPGTDAPQITEIDVVEMAGSPYEAFTIQATMADATHVERVEFYLDDVLIGTQYSAFQDTFFQPFAAHNLGMTRDAFYSPSGLPLEVVVYSTGGASSSLSQSQKFTAATPPVHLAIWAPGPDHAIIFDGDTTPAGTTQLVQVWAAQYDWECTADGLAYGNVPGLACADANPRPASELRLYLNQRRENTALPTEMSHNFTLDLSGLTAGAKVLQLRAYDEDGRFASVAQDLILEQGTPQLRMERNVVRQDNLFTVELTIYNEGGGSAQVHRVDDLLQGFVAIHKDTRQGFMTAGGDYSVRSKYDSWINSDEPSVIIDLMSSGDDYVTIAPGDSFTLNYEAIPVIYPGPSSQDHHIGVDDEANRSTVRYTYAGAGQVVNVPFSAQGNAVSDTSLGGVVPLEQAVVAAFASADYLLATSPYRLNIKTTNNDQVPDLLNDMARLARAADGVIAVTGIAPTYFIIDDLLEPGGYWYESLHPNFRQAKGGYVLFVGEDDVVPTQDAGWDVEYSDLRYASTGGAARPELIVGRVIGNDTAALRKPIQAAVTFHEHGVFFDSSHALMWSGRAHNESIYWDDVKAMDSRLDDTALVTRFRGKDYDSTAELLPVLQQNSAGQDWIIYRGHGGRTQFGYESDNALVSSAVSSLDLSSRPVVLALACTTGDYAGGSNGIAETFLNQGAAVFIGSVETSSTARNSDAARAFFNRWHSGRSVGWVLTDLMRDKWGSSTWWWPEDITWERWVYDYQLFGDPKYGAGVTVASQAPTLTQVETGVREQQENGFNAPLDVALPDLEVSETDEGWHYVSLPDGDRMTREGEYAVPVETITVRYPAGERVQDVTLELRSGLEVMTGLNIPVTVFTLDEAGQTTPALSLSPANAEEATSWHPELQQPFRWQVFENADGSSDLQLLIYPMYYNPATTDARYYRNWRFNVHTIETGVSVQRFVTPPVADPGDKVRLSLSLQNDGPAQDVIVSATIQSLGGEPLAGHPLRTLHALEGSAGFELAWDTTGLETGDYAVEITLSDSAGQILDRVSTVIKLGDDREFNYLPVITRP